jgi:hypothetical protein
MIWLASLTAYLWLTGGLGWAAAYEHGSGRELTTPGRLVVVLLWPAFALVSAVEETLDAARGLRG